MSWLVEMKIAEAAARAAANAIRLARQQGMQPGTKAGGEIVTNADFAADRIIRQHILDAFPNDPIYSEEAADPPHRIQSRRVWIVDPLDGTGGFARSGDEYAVSVGFAVDGRAVAGAVYVAANNLVYHGAVGAGAWRNNVAMTISKQAAMERAIILMSRKELAAGSPGRSLRPIARGSMACKLALLAAGEADLVLSFKHRREWGVCAGTALVFAAGGAVTDLDGGPLNFNRPVLSPRAYGLVASGKRLHSMALARAQILARHCSAA